MIYLIIGRTATGKDTLGHFLEDEGIKQIVSKTTRNKRDNEEDTHIFVSKEEYENDKENILIETEIDENKYYITKDMLKDDHYYIIDPNSAKKLIKITPTISYYIFYLNVEDEKIRQERFINRDEKCTIRDFEKRNESEKENFDNFEKSMVNETIYNDFGKNLLKINILDVSKKDKKHIKVFAKEIKKFDTQFNRVRNLIKVLKDNNSVKTYENGLIQVTNKDKEGNIYYTPETLDNVSYTAMYDRYLFGELMSRIVAKYDIKLK